MSSVKSPQEKKKLSLKRDRRNMYGESPHSSRKNIKRGKQNQHQEERRASNQILSAVVIDSTENSLVELEVNAEVVAKVTRLKGFKKKADRPLEAFLERQIVKRQRQGMVKNRE